MINPYYIINSYGLFAVMTTERLELIIEGSDDGIQWLPYEFKYKPGKNYKKKLRIKLVKIMINNNFKNNKIYKININNEK